MRILYSVALLLLSFSAFSQGNVFPPSGNVGIGTLNPTYTLDVNGSIRANQIFLGGTPLVSSPWTTEGNQIIYNSGNVGIGLNNPAYTLDVLGSVNATNFLIDGNPLQS